MTFQRMVCIFGLALSFLLLGWNSAFAFKLSPAELSALKHTIQIGKYPVRVIQKQWGNLERTVIIVGETHVVNKDRHESAKKLVSSFNFIGIEGIDPDESLAKELEWAYYFGSFFRREAGSFPGPIKVAQSRYYLDERSKMSKEEVAAIWLLRDFDRYGKEAIREGHPMKVTSEQPEAIYLLLQATGYKEGDLITKDNVDEFLQKMRDFLKGKLDLLPLEVLETGPESNISIQYKSSLMHQITATKRLCKAGFGFMATAAAAKWVGANSTAKCLAAAGGMGVLGYLFYYKMKYTQAEEALHMAAHAERNEVMAKQINTGLSIRPQVETMLVLVGQAHLLDILDILDKKYGFQEVQFDPDRL